MYKYSDIVAAIGEDHIVFGDKHTIEFIGVKPIIEATEYDLVWIKPSEKDKLSLIQHTTGRIVVCDQETYSICRNYSDKAYIVVSDPKKAVIQILNTLFISKPSCGTHPSAFVSSDAEIGNDVYIGPRSVIGNCTIGSNTNIEGSVFIYDGTIIGSNVRIQAGAVIGSDGFGHHREADGTLSHFPHIGCVRIMNNVHIGSNVCIDRGVLGETIIGSGTKINSLSYVAHNVVIGRNNFICPSVLFSGSVVTGDNVYIATGANIRNKIVIGDSAMIGMGAVVVKDVLPHTTVIGNPAKQLTKEQN